MKPKKFGFFKIINIIERRDGGVVVSITDDNFGGLDSIPGKDRNLNLLNGYV